MSVVDRVPAVSFGWHEGRYFDRWMLVHLLSGFTGGTSNVLFGLSRPAVLAIGLGLMVLWEVGEYAAGVREVWVNRAIDLIWGVAGMLLALGLAPRLGHRAELLLLWSCVGLLAAAQVAGWRAYRRRTAGTRAP